MAQFAHVCELVRLFGQLPFHLVSLFSQHLFLKTLVNVDAEHTNKHYLLLCKDIGDIRTTDTVKFIELGGKELGTTTN